MAEETWRVLLEEGPSETGGAAGGGGVAASSSQAQASDRVQKEAAEEQKKSSPVWAMVGKFIAPLVAVAGTLAFVIQMIRRSKVFSTFMDSFLTILSAVVDILMIPLIPLLGPVLKWMLKLIPIAMDVSKNIMEFLKDPWSGIKKVFASLVEMPQKIGEFFKNAFKGTSLAGLGQALGQIGDIFTNAGKKIVPIFNTAVDNIQRIWSDSGKNLWQKIGATAVEVWNFIKAAAPIMWEGIKTSWLTVVEPAIINGVQKLFGTDAATILNDLLTGNWSKAWQDFCSWIGPRIENVWNNFYQNSLVPVWTKFYEGTLKPYWIIFTSLVSNLWQVLVSDIQKNWGVVIGIIGDLWTALTSNIGRWFSWLVKDFLPPYWKWLCETVGVMWSNLLSSLGPKIIEAFLFALAMVGKYSIMAVAALLESLGRIIYQGIIDIFVVAAKGIVNCFVGPINGLIAMINKVKFWGDKISEIDLGTVGDWVNKANTASLPESWGDMFKNLADSFISDHDWMENIKAMVEGTMKSAEQKLPAPPLILTGKETEINLTAGQGVVAPPPGWKIFTEAVTKAGQDLKQINWSDLVTAWKNLPEAFKASSSTVKDYSRAVDSAVDIQTAARIELDRLKASFAEGKATQDQVNNAQEVYNQATLNLSTTISNFEKVTRDTTASIVTQGTSLSIALSTASNTVKIFSDLLPDAVVKQNNLNASILLTTGGLQVLSGSINTLNADVISASSAFKSAAANLSSSPSLPGYQIIPKVGPALNEPEATPPPKITTINPPGYWYNPPGRSGGIQFDIGSKFVSKDMMAMVHRGEEITPASKTQTNQVQSPIPSMFERLNTIITNTIRSFSDLSYTIKSVGTLATSLESTKNAVSPVMNQIIPSNRQSEQTPFTSLGKDSISKDILALLNRGDKATVGSNKTTNSYNKPISINNTYNIQAGKEDLVSSVKSAADQSLKYNQMRGYV